MAPASNQVNVEGMLLAKFLHHRFVGVLNGTDLIQFEASVMVYLHARSLSLEEAEYVIELREGKGARRSMRCRKS